MFSLLLMAALACAEPPKHLFIVHPPSLERAATQWSEHRSTQGWSVSRIPWSGGDAESLRRTLRERVLAARSPALSSPIPALDGAAVLLLGDVPAKAGTEGIPTFRFDQPDRRLQDRRDPTFASDGPYQDLDDDGLPDVMLGRVPVTGVDAAGALLEKIRAAESRATPHWCVEVVGGEGRFGPYDALLEVLTSSLFLDSVPPEIPLRVSYAKATSPFCPPPSRLTDTVREQALSGAMLFNYIGHGHAEGLDRLHWRDRALRMLDNMALAPAPEADAGAAAAEAANAFDARPGGIALLVCCNTGWFDLADRECFAEALLRHRTGPIAVFAGSRPTHPYANAIVEREGVRRLLTDRPSTVGAWDLAVTRALASIERDSLDLLAAPIASQQKWPLSLRQMRRQHALLYNLLGDPTTLLHHPARSDDASIELLESGEIVGTIAGTNAGTNASIAEISIVEKRRPVRAGVEPAPPDAEDLDERARLTWPRANEWTLWRAEVPIVDGRFRVTLPRPLPPGAAHAIVRVEQPRAAPANADALANASAPANASSAAGATAPSRLVMLRSVDLAPLVRSGRDGQGLPSDRGREPR